MAAESGPKRRLETWKEVATFFRKDERTVKRWEAERGLPIRRLPGGARSRIFAVVSELEAWRDGANLDTAAAAAPEAQTADPLPPPPRGLAGRKRWPSARMALGATLIAAAGLAAFSIVSAARIIARNRPPPLEAQRAFLAASDDWKRRTPESLDRAIGEYNDAIARDPDYAEAYAGLASTYDLLREYTHMPAAQAYPLARAAATRAPALNDQVANAHAALAFAEYWGFWNRPVAAREFAKAIALDPRSVMARHWYATFLSATGDEQGALTQIDAAAKLEPGSLSVAADRGLILLLAGRDADGLAALRAVARTSPDFVSAHAYLADYDLNHGAYADYLAETRRVAELTADDEKLGTVTLAEKGLADGGAPAFLRALTERRLAQFRNGQASAYSVAWLYAIAGDQPRALAFLRLSLERRETDLMAARENQAFAQLRGRPEFADILAGATPLDAS